MKKFICGLVCGILLILCVPVFAETAKSIDVIFGRVKVTVDGKQVNNETLLYDGTTYLPLRAIGEALGLNVEYDQATTTAVLTSQNQTGVTPGTPATPISTAAPAPSTGQTVGQKNALEKAKQYLSVSAFSRKGLISQLEYEKFSLEDATYAADNCGANWNEQAAKKAKQYLDISSYSRDRLIEQLEYEGFTREQAIYGVEANGY